MEMDNSSNKKVDRIAEIGYFFNTEDMQGSLFEPKFEIQVEFREKNNTSHKLELKVNNRHHFPTLFIDVNGNLENEKKRNISVHPRSDMPLQRYIDKLAADKIFPVMKYTVPDGEIAGYYYVPEEFRLIIKAIIAAVVYLHRIGGSLAGPLSLDNFVVYQGFLAIRKVPYLEFGKVARKHDFNCIYQFISEKIFGPDYIDNIPKDMQGLLQTMQFYPIHSNDDMGEFVQYHVATMTHSERVQFMINCSDKEHMFESRDTDERSNHFKSSMEKLSPKRGWTNLFVNTVFPPVVNCYNKGKDHYIDGEEHKDYAVKRSAVKCCRNLASHLGEHMIKYTVLPFTDKDIDLMVTSVFGDLMVEFAKSLYYRKVLFDVITWQKQPAISLV